MLPALLHHTLLVNNLMHFEVLCQPFPLLLGAWNTRKMITLGRIRLSWGPNGPKGQSVSFPPPVNRGIVLRGCILGTPPSIQASQPDYVQAGRYVGLRPYNFPDGGTIF